MRFTPLVSQNVKAKSLVSLMCCDVRKCAMHLQRSVVRASARGRASLSGIRKLNRHQHNTARLVWSVADRQFFEGLAKPVGEAHTNLTQIIAILGTPLEELVALGI
jgi:hypothetical protein